MDETPTHIAGIRSSFVYLWCLAASAAAVALSLFFFFHIRSSGHKQRFYSVFNLLWLSNMCLERNTKLEEKKGGQ